MVVQFDFSGALALARELHALSQQLRSLLDERRDTADGASAAWTGPAGDDFRSASDGEQLEGRRIARALAMEATAWAEAWAGAVDDQRRRDGGDGVGPGPVAVPQPPGFRPLGPDDR